jgi:uncharacterized membrane protein
MSNKPNKWLQLINIPIQMGVIIFLFSYFGSWLDEKYPNEYSAYTIIFSVFSVFLSIYNVIKQVNNLNNE